MYPQVPASFLQRRLFPLTSWTLRRLTFAMIGAPCGVGGVDFIELAVVEHGQHLTPAASRKCATGMSGDSVAPAGRGSPGVVFVEGADRAELVLGVGLHAGARIGTQCTRRRRRRGCLPLLCTVTVTDGSRGDHDDLGVVTEALVEGDSQVHHRGALAPPFRGLAAAVFPVDFRLFLEDGQFRGLPPECQERKHCGDDTRGCQDDRGDGGRPRRRDGAGQRRRSMCT